MVELNQRLTDIYVKMRYFQRVGDFKAKFFYSRLATP